MAVRRPRPVHVFEAAFGQALAHPVDVEAQFAGLERARTPAFSTRALDFSRTSAASARATTQTPSSSATIRSPGLMRAPAQTTGH